MFENPLLNEEERALRETAPEECLRRLAARGQVALDSAAPNLPPAAAEALRVIVSGERITPQGETLHLHDQDRGDALERTIRAPLPAGETPPPAPDWVRAFAAAYPEWVHHFERRPAVPDEALKTPLPARGGPAVPDEALKTPLPAQGGPAVPDEALKTPLPAQGGAAVPDEALKTPLPAQGGPAVPDEALKTPLPAGRGAAAYPEWARSFAAAYPRVTDLLEAGRITPHEAVATLRAMDAFLGNYPTGARYAAP